MLALLVSSLCHDLAHDGFSNMYHINAQTSLALKYNDKSPLEMHHCATAFRILSQEKFNILSSLNDIMFRKIRHLIIEYENYILFILKSLVIFIFS